MMVLMVNATSTEHKWETGILPGGLLCEMHLGIKSNP